MNTILTDSDGRPIPRPERPAEDASIEERIAWLRAMHAYNDRVTDIANGAFVRAFNKKMKRTG